jgi:uncharacterized protein
MRMIVNVLLMLAVAYAGLLVLVYVFQSRMVFFPEVDRAVSATPASVNLPFENLHLQTSDGIDLYGWYIPAAQPQGTVLFMHGNAGNISHRLDSLKMFHRLGYNTLIFDYRGYGNSGGKPDEQGTYRDAEAAWRYLIEQRHVPECRIVLFGESLGGAIAAWLAATSRDTLLAKPADCGSGCEAAIPAPDASQRRVIAASQKPGALVIASSFTSVPDLGQQLYRFLPIRLLARIRYDTRAYLQSVNAPVLIAHSPQDDIIPFAEGQALFAAAHPPKQFLELAGGHNDGFIFMREEWVKTLGDFLGEHVGKACGT